MAQEPLLPVEGLKRLQGSITRADNPKLQGWGYLTYLFPANPTSFLLGELQRCLKDPDWLAQLFIKHVRLERVGLGRGLRVDWAVEVLFLLTHPALS